jgi:cysteine-S-conjugate beta-lyase
MYNFDEIYDRKGTNSLKHDMLKIIFGTDDVLPMWVADMDFKTPSFIMDAIKERTNHEILGYTIKGKSFYESIVNWMENRHQWKIKSDWISNSPGVVPALALIVQAFTRPGDKIIVQSPVYFPFFSTVLDNGRQLINNELIYKNGTYTIDFDNFEKQIDSRTRMIIFCSPHNPVGRVWKREELEKLAQICTKNNILMVSDEIHSDIILKGHKHIPFASISEAAAQNSISTFAPSKTFNLAGLSTSFLIIPNIKLKTIYDNFLFDLHLKSGNIFGDIALEASYTHGHQWVDEMIAYLEANIEMVREFTKKHSNRIELVEPESTYLLWLDFRELKISDIALKEFIIKRAKLGMNPGTQFGNGGQGFMRMNVACPKSVVKQALSQLEIALNSL